MGLNAVWDPIKRPPNKPQVTPVPKVRSRFCFDFCAENLIRSRTLSCHCSSCLKRQWNDCKTKEAGDWLSTHMEMTAAVTLSSGSNLRSNRRIISENRRSIAAACDKNEIIALEAEDDSEGFSFWLALVTSVGGSWTYAGRTKSERGVRFVAGNKYITVRVLSRFPVDSPHTFKLFPVSEEAEWSIDAEAVIARQVKVDKAGAAAMRRSARVRRARGRGRQSNQRARNENAPPEPGVYSISIPEIARLEQAAEISFRK